mmetsp:Transcript_20537/g.23713  ORF Transcript_20537/g.23713 Transcript_20537/m.23713 type:complete len:205 (-) Transcript_20537:29-643(-)
MSDKEKLIFFRVRKTVMEMLVDRGYVVPQSKLNQTFEDFKDTITDSLFTISVAKDNEEGMLDDNRIIVFFPNEDKINQEQINNYIKKMNDQNIFHCILVVKGKVTPSAEKAVREFESTLTIEIFHEKQFYVNITRHEYVPKHIILTNDEKKELLKRYKVKDFQLPKIIKDDPIARYLGLKRGQVVKIIRRSETAGKYITYRLTI